MKKDLILILILVLFRLCVYSQENNTKTEKLTDSISVKGLNIDSAYNYTEKHNLPKFIWGVKDISSYVSDSVESNNNDIELQDEDTVYIFGEEGDKYVGLLYGYKVYVKKDNLKYNLGDKDEIKDALIDPSSNYRKYLIFNSSYLSLSNAINVNKRKISICNIIDYYTSHFKILINDIYPSVENEYSQMTDLNICIRNNSKQTIKYVWISERGYNQVDDPVFEFGSSLKKQTCIGPINSDEYATYKFDNVWMNTLVEYVSLVNIKIQYMNGKIYQIPISAHKDLKSLYEELDNDTIEKLSQHHYIKLFASFLK